ncbi:MAG: hypothetical protein LC104_19880 [Bacteroidales bacterium]|nr:hypothetical protein [Bacteroidales bacterium]
MRWLQWLRRRMGYKMHKIIRAALALVATALITIALYFFSSSRRLSDREIYDAIAIGDSMSTVEASLGKAVFLYTDEFTKHEAIERGMIYSHDENSHVYIIHTYNCGQRHQCDIAYTEDLHVAYKWHFATRVMDRSFVCRIYRILCK